MNVPQKTVQNRGKLKQQLILDCALELLYTEGPAGITLRAVAAKAGVPASSVSYYFPTLVELVQGAFAHYFDQLIPRMTGNIQRELGGSRDLKILAKALATEVSSRDSRTLLPLYETYLAVARHTELYPEADKAIAQIPIVVKAFLYNNLIIQTQVARFNLFQNKKHCHDLGGRCGIRLCVRISCRYYFVCGFIYYNSRFSIISYWNFDRFISEFIRNCSFFFLLCFG